MSTKLNQYLIVIFIVFVGLFFMRGGCGIGSLKRDAGDENLLSGFEDKKVWGISPERGFSLRLSKQHVSEGKYSLEVVYPKWGLPSINTKKLKSNWGHYDFFAFDVYNPQKEALNFKIRIDDMSQKRTIISRKLQPGLNKIKISREQMAKKVDAGNISFVVLYLNEPKRRYRLFFDNMRLERSGLLPGLESAQLPGPGEKTSAGLKIIPFRKAVKLSKPPVATEGQLKVALAKLKEVEDNRPLVSSGIPFAVGQLKSESDIAFFDKEGKEVPIAVKVLARWPQDQSIRSVLVQFRYTIEHIYDYATMKWGTKRTTKDFKIVEPNWDFAEGFVVLPAEWLCASQVTGEQVPMDGQYMFSKYEKNIHQYFSKIKSKGWTGDLRKDGYYSTPHTFYQFYARSGELKYFLAARRELLYYRENNILHEGIDRGGSSVNRDPRYIYMQAMADDYFLTGDPRTLEVAGHMAEFLNKYHKPTDGFYSKKRTNFWTERRQAFPFLGFITYYEMTNDPKYLKLSTEYMENLYKTQMQWPDRGGFIHNLYAHDPEEGADRDEYGGSPFMAGILLEPIIKYHRLTDSEIAADSIFRAVDWLINEGLVSKGNSFKYITARKFNESSGEPDVNLLVVHAFGYAYRLSGYQQDNYLKIGEKVFNKGIEEAFLNSRKHFNQNYRSSGHFLAYIKDALREKKKVESPSAMPKLTEEQRKKPNVLIFEGFEHSHGGFSSEGDSKLSIDSENVYLQGNSLKIRGKFVSSNLSAGVKSDAWILNDYPVVSFAYLIPKGTPVGMRFRTQFGDWACIGGTSSYKCNGSTVKKTQALIDDGQWHEIMINSKETLHSLLPGVERIAEFQFFTAGNAQKGDKFWIDEFKVRK